MNSEEQIFIGCRCGDEDCHYAAAGQPWCAACEEHIRLERLTDNGECPRHQGEQWTRLAERQLPTALLKELRPMSSMTERTRKYVLTVEVGASFDRIEQFLISVANRLDGRLTVTEWEESEAAGRLRQVGRRTLRKLKTS